MFINTILPDGRKRKTLKTLLIQPKDAYIRPKLDFKTSTSIWHLDEILKRRVNDWRKLTGEDGHTGLRSVLRKDGIYTGTYSVFPIPLMEYIIVRYAGERGNTILDSFAGGPPRAIVSSLMGMDYYGVDVRQDQIDENLKAMAKMGLKNVHYTLDDARYLTKLPKAGNSDDGLFHCAITCPPYYDVEVYSEQADDVSTFPTYAAFNAAMMMNAHAQFEHLKPGAFACIVVGNFRDKKTGELIDFRGHTVENFREVGFLFWEDVILSRNFGSAASRASNAWRGLKLVRRHEHLLVFRKPE
jgi:hypothetical protein